MVALLLSEALAGSLSGVVIDEATGTPLPNVSVYAYDLRLQPTSTVTNADGRFSLTLPEAPHRLLASPAYLDNHATRVYPEGVDFCAGALLSPGDDVTFALPEAAILTGQLLAPDGAPLVDAVVTASQESFFPRATLTDEDGEFAVVGLESGDWKCQVDIEGLPVQYLGAVYDDEEAPVFSLEEAGQTDVGSHTMLPGIVVEGGVYGPSAPVAAGTNVVVYAGGQITNVQTDEDGQYSADGLPPGEVLPWSEPAGLALTYAPDDDRPTVFMEALDEGMVLAEADISAPLEATLEILLVDEQTGEAIAGPGVMLYNSTASVGKGATADEDGIAQIVGLHGGSYSLAVYASDEGYTDGLITDGDGAELWIVVDDEDDLSVTIPLPPAVTLTGTVTSDDGGAVYGAMVLALSGEEAESTITDADGRFTLAGLPAGDWELQVSYAGYCPADPGWVTVYWPGSVSGGDVEVIPTSDGQRVTALDFTLPHDNDHDSMGDDWEHRYGLDVGRDDALEDLDADGYNNLYEYRAGTDPTDGLSGPCGCRDGAAALLILPLLSWRRRR